MKNYPFHFSTKTVLKTTPATAFQHLDDPKKLSTHMEKSSWMMAGSKMDMELDSKQGRDIGSIIQLKGQMMGIPLWVQEAVVQRVPNQLKEWETFGEQKMLIIDQYRMGFKLAEKSGQTELEVYIDYSLPEGPWARKLSLPLAQIYARWCTEKMAKDAAAHFS